MIISGPCSVESKEQVMTTAKQLKDLVNPNYFRAGIWKPRTRPDSFEGIGSKGIPWLKEIRDNFNIPVITEVGCAKHVELILKNDINAYWVGARTVTNPFSVQEIINATHKKDIEIFIKNPVFPDIELWTGAIERYLNAGFKNIYAIHRGFYPYEKTYLRNIPMWEIPIELARRFPHLEIICDPSHIAGNTKYIKEIAQQAINLNMAGLMVETHYDPQNALSDKNQQLKPLELKELLNNLNFKKTNTDNLNYEQELKSFRDKIDSNDYKLIEILQNRFTLSDEIGKLKKKHNITTLQLDRWKEIVESRLKRAENSNISKDFLLKILQLIHEESIRRQNNIINK
jgi:chorismate mutase